MNTQRQPIENKADEALKIISAALNDEGFTNEEKNDMLELVFSTIQRYQIRLNSLNKVKGKI